MGILSMYLPIGTGSFGGIEVKDTKIPVIDKIFGFITGLAFRYGGMLFVFLGVIGIVIAGIQTYKKATGSGRMEWLQIGGVFVASVLMIVVGMNGLGKFMNGLMNSSEVTSVLE